LLPAVAEGDHALSISRCFPSKLKKACGGNTLAKGGHTAQLPTHPGERVKVGGALPTFEEGQHTETGTVVGELAPPPSVVRSDHGYRGRPRHGPRHTSRSRAGQELGVDLAA
jgi:hypothetical protein